MSPENPWFHIPPFPSACWSRCLFFFLFIMHHKYILSIFMPSSHLHTGNKCLVGVDQAAIRKDTKRVVREKLSISNMSTDQQHLLGSVLLLLGQWNHDTTRVTAPEALSPSSPRNRSRDEFTSPTRTSQRLAENSTPSRDPQKRQKNGRRSRLRDLGNGRIPVRTIGCPRLMKLVSYSVNPRPANYTSMVRSTED
jgi:hypothetical protein